ncbi:ABC transporter substrate-binding protein [uncultured Robinsoniella sp.]|uniref:ABC transporter substrate-binding protein n=1 Tax=uncultured Robinsoniella sp. TaxID=904190 RepID=UPI00374F9341
MKKVWIGFIGGLCLSGVLLLQGCTQADTSPPEGMKETLTLMTISNGGQEVLKEAVEEFNASNTFDVEIACEEYSMEDFKATLARKMAANEEPDLFFSWQAGFLKAYVDKGKVLDLTSQIQNDSSFSRQFQEDDFVNVTFDGGIYAVPATKCISGVFYKKKLFEQYGLQVPETYQEFLNVCEVFKQNGIVPINLDSTPWNAGQLFLQVMNSVCGRELETYENLQNIPWTSDKLLKSAELLKDLYDMGYLPEDFLGTEGKAVAAEDTAMAVSGNWMAKWLSQEGEPWGVFLLPPLQEENRGIAIGGSDRSFAVSRSCKNPEAACSFLKELSSDKYQSKILYDEGTIPVVDIEADRSRLSDLQLECFDLYKTTDSFCLNMDVRFGPEFGDLFNETAQAVIAGEDYREAMKGLESYAKKQRTDEKGG